MRHASSGTPEDHGVSNKYDKSQENIMPEQINTLSCACGKPNATFSIPVAARIDTGESGETESVVPLKTWESGWFQPAANGAFSFTHGLNLEFPWHCEPMIVGKVIAANVSWQGGWSVGDIIFTHGSDFDGNTGSSEIGWIVTVDRNTCRAVFGNSAYFTCGHRNGGYGTLYKGAVNCKVVLHY